MRLSVSAFGSSSKCSMRFYAYFAPRMSFKFFNMQNINNLDAFPLITKECKNETYFFTNVS